MSAAAGEKLVEPTYVDAFDVRREVAAGVRERVLAAMGLDRDAPPPLSDHVAIVAPGERLPVAGVVELEDGTPLPGGDRLPRDVPYGYHHLHPAAGPDRLLLTGPGRCHLPAGIRAWGWAVQLATLRSAASWGIGDLDDLARLEAWTAAQGGGFVAVSPLSAPNPGPDPEPSPYYPSTRRFGNPLHIAVERVPGAEALGVALEGHARAGRELNASGVIERGAVLAAKLQALEAIHAQRAEHDRFEAWRAREGTALERWATFATLTEVHGAGWRSWPPQFHDPDGAAVADFAAQHQLRVAFHAWVQWCFDAQLAAASQTVRRIADMPVGVDPGGFDAWDWQDQLAHGASIGAPPDRFNAAGQDWGLPPLIPHRLREAGYRPFIETIRAQLRHAGGLRIDHVLGLFRLWWVPAGGGPAMGAYVRSATRELLEIVAIESERSGAVIIGEDLGTVPRGVRAELRRRRVLSTRLAVFERVPPARYPRDAFTAVTTHDLPTVAGIWTGVDLDDQAAAGIVPDRDALALLRERLARVAGVTDAASPHDVVIDAHRALAGSPASLVAASLEDAVGERHRPNIPGTTRMQRDNWSSPLARSLEELVLDPGVAALVAALRR